MQQLTTHLSALGKRARARVGSEDLRQLRWLKVTSWFGEIAGRW